MIKMKRGMTLIELMIVVTIVGILLAVLLPSTGRMLDKAREKTSQQNLENIRIAIASFYSDFEAYPGQDLDGDGVFSSPADGDTIIDNDALDPEEFSQLLIPEYLRDADNIPPPTLPFALLRRGLSNNQEDTVEIDGNPLSNNDGQHGGWRYYPNGATGVNMGGGVVTNLREGTIIVDSTEETTTGSRYCLW
ncbi:MAG: type II secretion system protein [bacterium]